MRPVAGAAATAAVACVASPADQPPVQPHTQPNTLPHTQPLAHPHAQLGHTVRTEWGLSGAQVLVRAALERGEAVVAVVVDVLSFSTAVSVCLEQGAQVYPYGWQDDSAQAFARDHDAHLAVGRRDVPVRGPVSLSPASLRDGLRPRGIERIVLPSPNGSSISTALAGSDALVLAGCPRNATAVARHVVNRMREHAARGRRVAVVLVAGGERWPDGSLRPAVEDLWGVGAVAAGIADTLEHQAGPLLLSPETQVAATAFAAVAHDLPGALGHCASGLELLQRGFGEDVALAAQLDVSSLVPVLTDGRFAPSGGSAREVPPEELGRT